MKLIKENMSEAIYALITSVFMLTPLLVGAQFFGQVTPEEPIVSTNDFYGILSELFVFVYSVFFAFAAFFILWAAFTYLVAGGNEEKVTEAKDRLVYSVVAIVVALLALSVDDIVADLIGATVA